MWVMSRYLVPIACKTLDVLECFRSPQEELTLEQVIGRTRIAHTTAFRILHTLVHRGYLTQSDSRRYRLKPTLRKTKVGFASLSNQTSFAVAITKGLEAACIQAGFDLLVRSNELDPDIAIANAQSFVAEKVDVAIEFQRHERAAHVIADLFASAAIPTIAVIVPHPGAIYFGVNNYQAGITAGHALAQHAIDHWQGKVDALLLLDLPEAGQQLQGRMTGVERGVEQRIKNLSPNKIARLDGNGQRDESARVTLDYLRRHPKLRRVAASAINDESAQGIADAVKLAGIDATCAIIGHGGSTEVMPLIADPTSPLIGTVGFFPEKYGEGLVELVSRLTHGDQVPPYHYMPHKLIR